MSGAAFATEGEELTRIEDKDEEEDKNENRGTLVRLQNWPRVVHFWGEYPSCWSG
jgi:hypothetical protein